MKKASLMLACVLLALTILVNVSSSATYDPWVDLDADGNVDIFDVVTLAGSYQTTGDPTKNVNVTNWPVATEQIVFWNQASGGQSGLYNASGFSQIHLSWSIANLGALENVTITVWARLDNSVGGMAEFVVDQIVVTQVKSPNGATTFAVPSEQFRFGLQFAPGTTANVKLGFYLTYA